MIYWRCQLRLSFFSFFSATSSWMIDYCRSFLFRFSLFSETVDTSSHRKKTATTAIGLLFFFARRNKHLIFILVISTQYPDIFAPFRWYNKAISWGRSPKTVTWTDSPFFHVCILWKLETPVAPSPGFSFCAQIDRWPRQTKRGFLLFGSGWQV